MNDSAALSSLSLTPTLVDRVRGEYIEMPGLRLTLPQAQRLFGLNPVECALVFEALTREKFLCRGGAQLTAERSASNHSVAATFSRR